MHTHIINTCVCVCVYSIFLWSYLWPSIALSHPTTGWHPSPRSSKTSSVLWGCSRDWPHGCGEAPCWCLCHPVSIHVPMAMLVQHICHADGLVVAYSHTYTILYMAVHGWNHCNFKMPCFLIYVAAAWKRVSFCVRAGKSPIWGATPGTKPNLAPAPGASSAWSNWKLRSLDFQTKTLYSYMNIYIYTVDMHIILYI